MALSMVTGLEGFVMLLPWFRVDRSAHQVSTKKPGWFEWGYIDTGYEYPDWYILIKLPSYLMKSNLYTEEPPTWHQRCLLFRERLPGGNGAWKEIEMECDYGS